MKNPGKNLPRAILCGTLIVTMLYQALNLVFALALSSTTLQDLARRGGEEAVVPIARLAADRLMGPAWGQGLGLGVGLMLVASLSALLLTGPQVLAAMLRDGLMDGIARTSFAGQTGSRVASFGMAASAIGLLWTGSFDQILIYSGLGLASTSLLSVGAVVVLRWQAPSLPRPFRVPLYPWVPGCFLLVTLALTVAVMITEPGVAVWSGLSVAAGLPVHLLLRHLRDRANDRKPGRPSL